MKSYYFKLFIDGKVVYLSERTNKPFNKDNINFEIGEDRLKKDEAKKNNGLEN